VADPWINHFVVVGPIDDVRAFVRAAVGSQPPDWDSSSTKPVRLSLSFSAFYKRLPPSAKRRVPEVESEPYELNSDRMVLRKDGHAEKTYRFELSHYEPDLLLTEVSKLFPRLCFILGWVAPNVDEAASKFIRAGKVRLHRMSDSRREEIREGKCKEWGEDSFEADIEGDWVMLDEIVEHWTPTVTATLKEVKGKNRKLIQSQRAK
jgi:hypothetical protein